MRVLGFMSGTSLDGIDMAILETDGETVSAFGPAAEAPLPEALREKLKDAIGAGQRWERGRPEPNAWGELEAEIADAHFDAAEAFLKANGLSWSTIDLVGFHGVTVLHEAPASDAPGRTRQLGDGARLAERAATPVAFDFRSADVAAGGQGAPLVPIYHAALVKMAGLKPPTAVLNLGGVGNITLIAENGALEAFDTGPGNGLIDQWLEAHDAGRIDLGGALACSGRVHEAVVEGMLAHPFFARGGPKSLDRYDFTLAAVEGLSLADGAATLAAFTASAVALALTQRAFAAPSVIVCGGGRKNTAIMRELGLRTKRPMQTAEAVGWDGDALEAQAFAFLAARTARGLPISFPGTTGVSAPTAGGKVADI